MNTKLPIVIAGPTASGKTDIALALARLCGGDIISADSRQVYKLLTTGTAAPKGVWQNGEFKTEGINCRLVDFLDINESFDVSKFIAAATEFVEQAKGRQQIFAGGTGMYLQGYFTGMDKLPQADEEIRKNLKALADAHGKEHLHNLLKEKDPQSAVQIPAGNIQRVMRALEICMLTGGPASALKTGKFSADIDPLKVRFFYINWAKELLEERIVQRTNIIFEPMVKEAQHAVSLGYAKDCCGLRSLGYREALEFAEGKITKAQAIEKIIILTRQYAKRQRTWFGRYKNIVKIDINAQKDFNAAEIAQRILEWKER